MEWSAADANSYRPFKILDATLVRNISEQLDSLEPAGEEGASGVISPVPSLIHALLAPIGLVSGFTKALCCEWCTR